MEKNTNDSYLHDNAVLLRDRQHVRDARAVAPLHLAAVPPHGTLPAGRQSLAILHSVEDAAQQEVVWRQLQVGVVAVELGARERGGHGASQRGSPAELQTQLFCFTSTIT